MDSAVAVQTNALGSLLFVVDLHVFLDGGDQVGNAVEYASA